MLSSRAMGTGSVLVFAAALLVLPICAQAQSDVEGQLNPRAFSTCPPKVQLSRARARVESEDLGRLLNPAERTAPRIRRVTYV